MMSLLLAALVGLASAGQVSNQSGSLKTLLHANEGTGTTASDASTNGNAATLSLGATWANGKWSTGFSYDGVDDLVSVTAMNTINQVFTFVLWIKPDTTGKTTYPWAALMNKNSRCANGWYSFPVELAMNYSTRALTGFVDSGNDYSADLSTGTPSGVVTLGQWSLVAMSYSSPRLRIYHNGTLVASASQAVTLSWGNSGCPQSAGQPESCGTKLSYAVGRPAQYYSCSVNEWTFKGVIDDAVIYNRELSLGEIQHIYVEGLGRHQR